MLRAILGKKQEVLHIDRTYEDESEHSDWEEDDAEVGADEVLEPWVEWVQRATHTILEIMRKLNMEDWVAMQTKNLWCWAAKTTTKEDARWTKRILKWTPTEGLRNVGHPRARWRDGLDQFTKTLPGFTDD